MILDYGKPDARLVWGDDFSTRQKTQSRGGAIVGGLFNGQGIQPTGVSSRVTYERTTDKLINVTQMTIALRFRTASALVPAGTAYKALLGKCTAAGYANNHFLTMIDHASAGASPHLYCYIGPGTANNFYVLDPLAVSTEYVAHIVYNGGAAAALRGLMFLQGLSVTKATNGTIPTSMVGTSKPLSALNYDGGTTDAPPNDFILREARIYNVAFDANEVMDDYKQINYSRIFGP